MNLQIEYTDIEKLIPYVNNAKQHSNTQINQIAASIREFGFNDPIGIDAGKGIIEGHGRLLAAQKAGLEKVPTIELSHLTAAQKKAYILAHNRLAEVGVDWDLDLLSAELEALQELDFNIDLTGFDESFLLEDTEDGLTDADAVPEIEEQFISQQGMVWLCGHHRVMCGDSTNQANVTALMGDSMADMLLTDPPYNVDYTGKTKDALKIENDKKSDGDFIEFLKGAFACANEVMKPGAVYYIWHADSEGKNFRQACFDVGWVVRQCLIWVKNSMVMGRQDYHWQHEPCLYGWKSGAGHLWASDRKQTTILEFKRPTKNDIHPTMKPVDLISYQVGNNTKKRDVVLDLFGGSGTTLIACHKTGRDCRIMEFDPKYCDVIIRRWQEYTGEQAILEGDDKTFDDLLEMR